MPVVHFILNWVFPLVALFQAVVITYAAWVKPRMLNERAVTVLLLAMWTLVLRGWVR